MDGKKEKTKILLPSAMMAVVGLLLGAAVGPVPMSGDLLGASGASTGASSPLLDAPRLESLLTDAAKQAHECPRDYEPKRPWSDQRTSCEFICPPPGGTVTVHVDADDPDAHVDGTGSCGRHDAHCSDRDYCRATVAYSAEADGACRGEADEAWASGFYLNCYANAEDADPGPGGGGDWCPVERPIRVCIDPNTRSSQYPHISLFAILCASVHCEVNIGEGTVIVRVENGQPGIYIGGFAGKVIGAVCDETGACHLVAPTLEDLGSGRTAIIV